MTATDAIRCVPRVFIIWRKRGHAGRHIAFGRLDYEQDKVRDERT